tara:strand:- start:2237 stop:3145 length:909 start_codon:yes stop_codon:yes gene_type:complete
MPSPSNPPDYEQPSAGGSDYLAADPAMSADAIMSEPSTIVPDILDETSVLFTPDPVRVLLGDRISVNLDPDAPFTINGQQMTVNNDTSGFNLTEWGWDSPENVPTWYNQLFHDAMTATATGAGGMIMLCSTTSVTMYLDPDQGGFGIIGPVPIYSHMSTYPGALLEPIMNEGGLTFDGRSKYGSATYIDPFIYDPREEQAINDKFGYDGVTYSPDAYGATYQRMEEELADGLSMISAQIHPRQNIRKTTAAPNLFESFETLTAQESVESPALVQSQEDIANSSNITTPTETNGSGGADGGYT